MIIMINMGRISKLYAVIFLTLLLYAEVTYTIYDPSATTTKPPRRRESLPWYLAGENVQPPADSLMPPESPGNTKILTKSGSNWRKYPASEIQQRVQIHRTFDADSDDDGINRDQYPVNPHELLHGIPSSEIAGNGVRPQHLYPKEIKTKYKIPAEQSLYEGATDDDNKPRKELIGLDYHPQSTSIVAKCDRQTGVQCPFPDATGQFIYPIDCKFFVNCWKGRAFIQPCAPGTLFNPETLECDFPHKVKCYGGELADFVSADYSQNIENREPLFKKQSAIYASSSKLNNYKPTCPQQMTGLLPHPADCTKFLQCANGNAIVMDCGPGTVFNPKLSVCDYPTNVKGCEDVMSNNKPSSVSTPPEHSLSSYRGENNQNSWNPISARQVVQTAVCPVDFSGMLPHPTDCKKFLQCSHGTSYIMDCGPGTVFNPTVSVCDWPYNVPGCRDEGTPTSGPSYDSEPWQGSYQSNNGRGYGNWHGSSHAVHGQYPNSQNHQHPHHNNHHHHHHHHHHPSQPRPCQYPECSIGHQPPTTDDGKFYPAAPHFTNRHDQQHQNKPWISRDSYSGDDNDQLGFTTFPTNIRDRVDESSRNHDGNYPNPHEYPRYPSGNRGNYGRANPNFSYPGGNVYVDNGYRPPGRVVENPTKLSPDNSRRVWSPNSGPYGDYHDLDANESVQHQPPHTFDGYDDSQMPSKSDGEHIGSLDVKLNSWLSKPNVIERGDKGKEQDIKLDGWSSKTNIFNQGQVGVDTKNRPSGIYTNVNGIKGHYITKEIEIHQNHSNTRHYTPSIPNESSTRFPIANYDVFNNRGSSRQEFNYTHSNTHSSNEFNTNQSRWKPIKYHNKTQDSVHNYFNQSGDVWKIQNKTNSHSYASTGLIDKPDINIAHDYNVPLDASSTIPPTITTKKSRPRELTLWEKPDTNVPSISIGEEEDNGNYSDEDGVTPDENKSHTADTEHGVSKFDIDVLDETDKWKPRPVNDNRNNKKDRDNSVIMTINKKIKDLDLFNVESAPWQEEEPPFPVYYIPPVHALEFVDDSKLITPSSGQFVRLRGGSSARDGYVEVQGIQAGWGVVCDMKNNWTVKKADIVCRQLGYIRGAESAWQGRTITKHIPPWIAATTVHCRGNETKFQACKFNHDPDCNIERDAVGVSCLPNRLAYCRKDEIPHGGNCYHLADSNTGLNHAEALNYCIARNSRLVDITGQMENNFLSDWLILNHSHVESIMTSGIGFTTFNRNLWLWEDSGNAKFKFTKWWPGWKEDVKNSPSAGSRPVCIIMKRKFPCHDRPDTSCIADYFFWDVEDCATSMKGHSYVCERPYDDISCIYGKGHQYSGSANISASGKPCLPWNDESVAYPLLVNVVDREVREKLKAHNFCRNPNPMKESRPWCFTGSYGEQEQCDIPSCGNTGTIRSPTGGQCKKGHFECMPGECIPSHWVCDGEEDCTNGRDESSCFQHLEFFKKIPGYRLDGHDVEKWLNTPAITCALRCKEAAFTCRSFSHKRKDNLCLLSDNNIGSSGALNQIADYDYYEMTDLSINCDGMFTCENKKCINRTQVCDGKNDCGDRSDENICSVANLDYAIRLAGSENSYEGRVEVKFLGHWGQVCDDGFGMINAEVICRELGFTLGALNVRPGGFFGNFEQPTRFMVDQLKCRGNETSLRECEFDGWGVHDCAPEEAVGIVCKTAVNTCPEGQWKCDNSPICIPSFFICDEVEDCPDGSDENSIHCKAPFEIRLVNGSSPREGRVEVRHHGVWGTVCDDDFSNNAAKVICKSLAYEGSAIVKKNGYFGSGEGIIWLDEVFCHGNETLLYRCEHSHWGHNNCKHDEDVGVICRESTNSTDENESLRAARGRNIDDILPSDCGKRVEDFGSKEYMFERVVRGSIAPKDSYPWQASIRIRGHSRSSHWCGAVIISPLHVLTAAHCLNGYNKGTYFIRAGDYNTEIAEDTEVDANIEDYYIHEEFRKGQRMNNDIALVLLKGRGIPLGEHIMPICLPPTNIEYPQGLNCTISGFGSIETGQSVSSHDLRFGWVPLIDQSICRADYVYGEGAISQGMMCAGYLDEGVDSCDGDSGGPLACKHNGAFTLYGITSWGQHCGEANKPGVYVRVAHYRDWIDKKIRDSLSGR